MSHNNAQGRLGENVATDFLLKKNYEILEKNYRFRRAEIDLIARENNILVFIEVKLRSSDKFGFPEEAVSLRKQELFLEAAEHYIEKINWQQDIRFDIVAITQNPSRLNIHHIEDAFHLIVKKASRNLLFIPQSIAFQLLF
jgi:putative endonuclease